MKLSNIKNIFKDWVKAGHRFGYGFSDYVTSRLDMSPKSAQVGGGIFDIAAGGGLVYLAATSAIGTVVGMVAAVSAVLSAPVAAIVTVAVGTIWLALSTMTAGIGFGLLDAACEKFHLPKITSLFKRAKSAVNHGVETISTPFKKAFGADAKISRKFKNAANNNKPSAKPSPAKPAPKLKP